MNKLYRAWDNDRKEYLSAGKVLIEILPHIRPQQGIIYLDTLDLETNRFNIEQFTNIQDEKGINIFESDIVSLMRGGTQQDNPELVEWEDYGWNPWIFGAGDHYCTVSNILIIGNIHQHFHLLNKK